MTERTYRVIVRGTFTDLDPAQRATLLAEAADHDLLAVKFTDAGTLFYDRSLHAFTFRCVVRQPTETEDEAAAQEACDRAAADLAARGLAHSDLRATATSVDDMKIRRRG